MDRTQDAGGEGDQGPRRRISTVTITTMGRDKTYSRLWLHVCRRGKRARFVASLAASMWSYIRHPDRARVLPLALFVIFTANDLCGGLAADAREEAAAGVRETGIRVVVPYVTNRRLEAGGPGQTTYGGAGGQRATGGARSSSPRFRSSTRSRRVYPFTSPTRRWM